MPQTRLDERFSEVPKVVAASGATVTTSSTTATSIPASIVDFLPGEAGEGTTVRWRIWGTAAGGNAAHTVTVLLLGTTLCTMTADDASAVDWCADVIVRFNNAAVQKVCGIMLKDTADPDVQVDAGAVNASGGGRLQLFVTAGNGSDTITVETCITERWVQ